MYLGCAKTIVKPHTGSEMSCIYVHNAALLLLIEDEELASMAFNK